MTGLLFILLLLVFLGIFGYSWYRLHKEVHVHATGYSDTPKNNGLDYSSFAVTTEDNETIQGWYIPVEFPKAFVILVHGRLLKEGGRAMMIDHAKYLHTNGYAAILFDMRGVGESSGNTITLGVKEWRDVVAIYEYVKKMKEVKNKKIGFLGISMGAATALIAAGKEKIGDFVVASVPYASFLNIFAMQVKNEKLFPVWIFQYILYLAALIELGPFYFLYNPIFLIHNIVAPIFLISGRKDTMVNPKDAWRLYKAANKPKEFWEADAPHNIHGTLKEEFETKVLEFLDRYAVN